jgi:5-methylcytosine-specific restriction endonuclease McrA
MSEYYEIKVSKAQIEKERKKARELKKTNWWRQKLALGVCHYCQKKFDPKDLTMDHIVPIARGGKSTKGNIVPACKQCNVNKKLDTPVEQLFKLLEKEKNDK